MTPYARRGKREKNAQETTTTFLCALRNMHYINVHCLLNNPVWCPQSGRDHRNRMGPASREIGMLEHTIKCWESFSGASRSNFAIDFTTIGHEDFMSISIPRTHTLQACADVCVCVRIGGVVYVLWGRWSITLTNMLVNQMANQPDKCSLAHSRHTRDTNGGELFRIQFNVYWRHKYGSERGHS